MQKRRFLVLFLTPFSFHAPQKPMNSLAPAGIPTSFPSEESHPLESQKSSNHDPVLPTDKLLNQQPLGELQNLTEKTAALESQVHEFVLAEIQHLREMAILNRISDALALKRSYTQLLADSTREALEIFLAQQAWVLEPDASGKLLHAYDQLGKTVPAAALPNEVKDLFNRLVTEKSSAQTLSMPPYHPTGKGIYIATPIASAEYVMAVLVILAPEINDNASSVQNRLLASVAHQTAIACENNRLFETISNMIVEVVVAMALAIESRDPYTGGHVVRVTAYSLLLAQQARLDPKLLPILRLGGLLHDIGKIAVPDAILRKPARLDNQEQVIMQSHAAEGHKIVKPIPQLAQACDIVRSHHERYDGKGYPDALVGNNIPLLARVTAIADTYDAMTSDRPYRKGLHPELALHEINRGAGAQFDPDLAKVFAQLSSEQLTFALGQMNNWLKGTSRSSVSDLMSFLNINRPKTAA